MKMKFGALVVDGRGKIGGHVASKNRGGAYLRTKSSPANAQSVSQSAVRNRFTAFAQGWRSLTQAQRDAWNNAVPNYSRTDLFGDIRNPSGINLYQRLNNVLSSIGVAALSSPPLPSSVGIVSALSMTAAVAVPAVSLVLSNAVPAATALKIFATAPGSAGKAFVKGNFRLITTAAPAATTPINLLTAYNAKFGNTGAVGQKIFVKIVPVNNATGQMGSPSIVSVITVA